LDDSASHLAGLVNVVLDPDSDLCLNQIVGEKLVADVIPEGRRPLTICSRLGDIERRYRPVAPEVLGSGTPCGTSWK
jgi:hypothetical protein